MLTLGIDARKRTHTIVAADQQGQQLAVKTVGTSTRDHLGLLTWAEKIAERAGDGSGLLWAIEDCRICRGGWNATCLPRARPSSGSRPSSWLTSGTPPGPWQVRPDRRAGRRPRWSAGTGPAGGPAGWPGPGSAAAG